MTAGTTGTDRDGTAPDKPDRPDDGPNVLDLAAFVVGYGLAAVGVRSLLPAGVAPGGVVLAVLVVGYVWLGLAISGPFILLRRASQRAPSAVDRPARARIGRPLPLDAPAEPRFTRAESAWLLIGAYWVAAVILVVPTRMSARGVPILGLVPVLAILFLWIVGPARRTSWERPAWTHRVATIVLATWPIAWLSLILLTRTFG